MAWIELITLLALVQLLYFAILAGRARGRYGIKAPAITGHEIFERHYRVQMNTIEMLILFLPALWIAAIHWPPTYIALIGAVYLVGRAIYKNDYVKEPSKRALGYGLSATPTLLLLLAALIGVVRVLLH